MYWYQIDYNQFHDDMRDKFDRDAIKYLWGYYDQMHDESDDGLDYDPDYIKDIWHEWTREEMVEYVLPYSSDAISSDDAFDQIFAIINRHNEIITVRHAHKDETYLIAPFGKI